MVTSLPLKVSKFVITSPSIAPLQCPTCNGPVGLAETNSTLYLFFLEEFDPYFSFRFNKSFKNFCQKSSLNSIFKKPGSAINIFLNSGNFLIRFVLSNIAISFGFLLFILDNTKAALHDISPCRSLGGNSIVNLFKLSESFICLSFSRSIKNFLIFSK